MKIDVIKSPSDVVACVDIYQPMNEESFLPSSHTNCISSFMAMASAGFFIRILREGDVVTGFIIAEEGDCPHVRGKVLRQVYYASSYKGLKAVKAVCMLHGALEERAEARKIPIVMSQGSFLDPENKFTRILERMGWERRHYLAIHKTSHFEVS